LSEAAERNWAIELLPRAIAGLEDLLEQHGDEAFNQALEDILALEEDPTPKDAERLRSTKDHYQIYICRSRYRAIYRILFQKRRVLIERVGPRGSVYLRGRYVRW
jgi:mRNA-degrading endonuclease RelE of RelBE toxin-antitoxin system